MLGLKGTYKAIKSANGPAQLLIYSFWGMLLAGLFYGICPDHIPNSLVASWGLFSALIIPVTIWGSKHLLKRVLVGDLLFSSTIFALLLFHPEHQAAMVYMARTVDGYIVAQRPSHSGLTVSEVFQFIALVWLILHATYLANLTQRQIYEKERFDART